MSDETLKEQCRALRNTLLDTTIDLNRYQKQLELYEQAIREAEAILGGEYAMTYGPFFDLVESARNVGR